jgi:hypothetical protein
MMSVDAKQAKALIDRFAGGLWPMRKFGGEPDHWASPVRRNFGKGKNRRSTTGAAPNSRKTAEMPTTGAG